MTNQLIPYQEVEQFGKAMVASGFFKDVSQISQAIVKIQAGAELGLPPFASMTGIHIINGKPVLGANILATLIKNDPRYDYRVIKLDDTVCTIKFFEGREEVGVSTFTIEDAKKAGTQNTQKFPRNMLFARSMSNGAKWYCPGIFGGAPIYTPEDFGLEVDEDGAIIEGSYATTEPAPQRQPTITKPAPVMPDAPLADDELVIMETAAPDFFDVVTALIDRYENVFATQAAAKKLGFKGIPKDAKARLAMYQFIKAHAAERNAEEAAAEQTELFPDAENGAYQG